jgi:hypothetical protein
LNEWRVIGWFDLNEIRNFLKLIFELRGEDGWYYVNWMRYWWTIRFELNQEYLDDIIWIKWDFVGQ